MWISSFNDNNAFNQSDFNFPLQPNWHEAVVYWLKASIGQLDHHKDLQW